MSFKKLGLMPPTPILSDCESCEPSATTMVST